MIVTKVKLADGRRIKLGGMGFEKYQMFSLGRIAERAVEARVSRGIGSNDTAMPPLQADRKRRLKSGVIRVYPGRGYAWYKKLRGAAPIRDLRLSGQMLHDFGVKYADATKVRLDLSTRKGRIKARANEKRAPWYGFSRNDQKEITREAVRIFGLNLRKISFGMFGPAARRPIWMDPRSLVGERLAA